MKFVLVISGDRAALLELPRQLLDDSLLGENLLRKLMQQPGLIAFTERAVGRRQTPLDQLV